MNIQSQNVSAHKLKRLDEEHINPWISELNNQMTDENFYTMRKTNRTQKGGGRQYEKQMFTDETIKEFELRKEDHTMIIDEDNLDYVSKNKDYARNPSYRNTKMIKFEKYQSTLVNNH